MKYQLYSIYDSITESFSFPFHALNENDAIRAVRLAAGEGSKLSNSPSDFTLYFLGSFNDTDGQFTFPGQPLLLERVTSILNPTLEVINS